MLWEIFALFGSGAEESDQNMHVVCTRLARFTLATACPAYWAVVVHFASASLFCIGLTMETFKKKVTGTPVINNFFKELEQIPFPDEEFKKACAKLDSGGFMYK